MFLGTCLFLNYYYDFENTVLDHYFYQPIGTLFYFIFYIVGYYGVAVPHIVFTKSASILKNKAFWIKSLSFVLLISIAAGFYFYAILIKDIRPYDDYLFVWKMSSNIKRFIIYIPFLILLYMLMDRMEQHWYGLRWQDKGWKPYMTMLIFMLPLLIWASFQPDFLHTYPIFKPWKMLPAFGWSKSTMFVVYEVFYALDFIMVEWVFRGALVIGMVHILGEKAILPMASIYTFLHFGKPMPEAISSFFGGYILGTFAHKSKSIWGGVIVHMGIALMMDMLALLQYFYNDQN